MAYRNKTYICFEADTDLGKYEEMKKWNEDDRIDFNFHDAHDINNLRDGSQETTIKPKLRERLNNTKMFVVLVGAKTATHYQYVRWEIEIALEKEIPIIVVNLNGLKEHDNNLCPPILRNELAVHIPFDRAVIDFALNHHEDEHKRFKKEGHKNPTFLKDWVYQKLGK